VAHKEFEHWSDKKKVEVVTTYLVLGKVGLTAATTGVPEGTLRRWKFEPWWAEMVAAIQADSDQELDAKLAKNVDKALDLIKDRLENGDFIYNPKTGEFARKPVSMRDTWKVTSEMVDKRFILRKQPKEQANQEAIGDILKKLAVDFATMAKKKVQQNVDLPSEDPTDPGSPADVSGGNVADSGNPVS